MSVEQEMRCRVYYDVDFDLGGAATRSWGESGFELPLEDAVILEAATEVRL